MPGPGPPGFSATGLPPPYEEEEDEEEEEEDSDSSLVIALQHERIISANYLGLSS